MTPHQQTQEIIRSVAKDHRVPLHLIMSPRRTARVVRARHAAIRAVYDAKPYLSSTDLGEIFGMHHTAILYALGRVKRKPTV